MNLKRGKSETVTPIYIYHIILFIVNIILIRGPISVYMFMLILHGVCPCYTVDSDIAPVNVHIALVFIKIAPIISTFHPCQTGPCAFCRGSCEYRNVPCLYRIVSYLYRTRSRPYQFMLISHQFMLISHLFCSYRTCFAHIAPVLLIYIALVLLISHRFMSTLCK